MSTAILDSIGYGLGAGVAGSLAGYSLYSCFQTLDAGLTLLGRTADHRRINDQNPVMRALIKYQSEFSFLYIIRSVGYLFASIGLGTIAYDLFNAVLLPQAFNAEVLAIPLGYTGIGLVPVMISIAATRFYVGIEEAARPQNQAAQPQPPQQPPAQPQNNNNAGNGAEGQQA